ncbi:hypothetical protein SCUCBS95973_009199 [Sporothrix curviconia]|uniref:Transcription factor Iwr1 domain-containing protein n=1 Tax=Sporothrix curviconia TaxID=1260050 RepID=A0ABP0CMC7_9PEZI
MSLPPQVIQVKRKRTEDGPMPSYLRIENTTKRHRSDAFLYRRHDPQAAAAAHAAKHAAEAEAEAANGRAARPPTIQSSRKGDEKRKKPSDISQPSTPTKATPTATTTATATAPSPLSATPSKATPSTSTEPRRFHLSRDSLLAAHSSATSALGVSGAVGVRKRSRYSSGGDNRHEPAAVFVEKSLRWQKKLRRVREGKSNNSGVLKMTTVDQQVALAAVTETIVAPLPKRPSRRVLINNGAGSGASTGGASTPAPVEGTATATATATAPASNGASTEASQSSQPSSKSATPALPPSLRNRQWDTDMDQLTRDMNDYTLELIGRNLAQMQMQSHGSRAARAAAPPPPSEHEMSRLANERRKAAYARFKPKPGPRYAERHADRMTDGPDEDEAGDDDNDDDSGDESMTTDDEDYVTETYVRIPGHEAVKEQAGGNAVPGNIGLLVFDNEPDLEFFYGVEEDSEEDWEDDEDENAENYYTHDYPEDEISSDDEYGRDAYHYRTGNASDLEEFESDDKGGGAADGSDGKNTDGALEFPGNMKLAKPGDF